MASPNPSPSASPSPDATSVAMDVADKIVELGLGAYEDNLYVGSMPDGKVATLCICTYDLGDTNPTRFYDRTLAEWQNDGFQLTVRAASYQAAWVKMNKLRAKLDQIAKWSTPYWDYKSLFLLTGPRSMGKQKGTDLWMVTSEWTSRRNAR